MSASHTPGPWTHGHLGQEALWVGPSHDQRPVALVPHDIGEGARDESRHNARLIATAPCLLAVVQKLFEAFAASEDALDFGVRCDALMADAKAALAKAIGSDTP